MKSLSLSRDRLGAVRHVIATGEKSLTLLSLRDGSVGDIGADLGRGSGEATDGGRRNGAANAGAERSGESRTDRLARGTDGGVHVGFSGFYGSEKR